MLFGCFELLNIILCLESFCLWICIPKPEIPNLLLQPSFQSCIRYRLCHWDTSCKTSSDQVWQRQCSMREREIFKLQVPRIHRCTSVTMFFGRSSRASLICFHNIICQSNSLHCSEHDCLALSVIKYVNELIF